MTHLSGQQNFTSLRCSWSIACRRCSNYIFILGLTHGFNKLRKDKCKTRQETFKFWYCVRHILETCGTITANLYHTASMGWLIIDSVNGLSPFRRQAIAWTKTDLVPVGPLRINFCEVGMKIHFHSHAFENVICKISAMYFVQVPFY